MKITPQQVESVANLASLELTDAEVAKMTTQLDRLLQYVEKLTELDTTGIEPTTHALQISNAFREDVVHESLSQEEALRNAPRQNGEAFVVPKVL